MSEKPIRLQLSRRKGFDLQAVSLAANGLPAVNVARPSKWGNPWRVGEPGIPDAAEAVRRFRELSNGTKPPAELRGKNLACWCSDGPCHADVLLEIANR